MNSKNIIVYTDGAAKGNPGRAGWGVVIMFKGTGKLKTVELGGAVAHATNNQMELTGAIQSLKYIAKSYTSTARQDLAVEIFSDSKYVILGITEWIASWMKNGWRNAAKKPVVNRELWEELYKLNQEIKPKWNYVKGHNDHVHNDRADLIATSFTEGNPVELRK